MIRGRLEQNSNICMNLHHIVQDKPAGVMFAYLVDNEVQPQGFDVFKLSAGLYMCIPLGDNNVAAAIGADFYAKDAMEAVRCAEAACNALSE